MDRTNKTASVHLLMEERLYLGAVTSDKWDKIDSGKWIQKTVWNRMVTMMDRDQPHKKDDLMENTLSSWVTPKSTLLMHFVPVGNFHQVQNA